MIFSNSIRSIVSTIIHLLGLTVLKHWDFQLPILENLTFPLLFWLLFPRFTPLYDIEENLMKPTSTQNEVITPRRPDIVIIETE